MVIAMRIRWHRRPGVERIWYAEIDGTELAVAANTSQTGSEDYPWDWYLTDAGVNLAGKNARHHTGSCDTLRSAKADVLEALAPR